MRGIAILLAATAMAQSAIAQDVVMRRPLPATASGAGTGNNSGGQQGGTGQTGSNDPSTPRWVLGDEVVTPGCSANAATTATVTCEDGTGKTLPDASCTAPKPSGTGTTSDYSACTYSWLDGEWSAYNSTCSGYSTRTRDVSCIREDGKQTVVDDSLCDANSPDAAKIDNVGNTSQCQNMLTTLVYGPRGYNYYPSDPIINDEYAAIKNEAPSSATSATYSPSGYAITQGSYSVRDLLGVLNVGQTGDYTFTITADDAGRIIVDGRTVVEASFNGGLSIPGTATVHLTAGEHNYEAFTYQLGGDQFMTASISGAGAGTLYFTPGTTTQNVADYSHVTSQLTVRRWNGIGYGNPDVTGLESVIAQTRQRAPDSLDQEPFIPGYMSTGAGGSSAFDATGTLAVKTAGQYTFALSADDAGRVLIDGQMVVQAGYSGAISPTQATVTLSAGNHSYEAFGYQGNGSQNFDATINGPDVPSMVFSPN